MSLIIVTGLLCLLAGFFAIRWKKICRKKCTHELKSDKDSLTDSLKEKFIKNNTSRKNDKITFSNIAEGTHFGSLTEILAEDLPWDHRLVSFVEDGTAVCINHGADIPVGVIARASLAKNHVSIQLLGCSSNTILMTAHTPILRGEFVYTAVNGSIQGYPKIPGSYYKVGMALTAADTPGMFVEVDPCMPIEIAVK